LRSAVLVHRCSALVSFQPVSVLGSALPVGYAHWMQWMLDASRCAVLV
jgi:hypothetical protein